MSDNGYRCGHAACQCTTVPDGAQFCSDFCREAAAAPPREAGADIRCGCGHAVCQSDPESDLKDGTA